MPTLVGTEKDLVLTLNALIALDLDAIEAYRAAIERLDDVVDKCRFLAFLGDHQRHVARLRLFVIRLGGDPADGPDAPVLPRGKRVLGGLFGDRAILQAMKSNENATTEAYERAFNHADLPQDVRIALSCSLEDERRHHAYIDDRLGTMKAIKEDGDQGSVCLSRAG